MLQKLNEKIQGLIAWIIIILIAITFTLFGVDYYLQAHHRSDAVASVNGTEINRENFETNYRRVRQQQDIATLTAERDKEIKQQVLDEMIVNAVTVQSAHKNGFEISLDQAKAAIAAIPQFLEDGKFSIQRYQQTISSALYTPESFLKQVKQGMLLNQVRFALIGTAFVLPSEIKRFVKLYMQTRNYEYLVIPFKLFLSDIAVSETLMREYYKNHTQEFMTPEKVSIEYIRLTAEDIRRQVKVSAQEIERFYQENLASFKTPAQWKVSQIYLAFPDNPAPEQKEQIKNKALKVWQDLSAQPEKFDSVMNQVTDDKLSLSQKGELPWITAGQSSLDTVLVELKEKGQISKPFAAKNGYQILKLIDFKPSQTKSLDEVRTQISDQITSDKVQHKFAESLEKMTELSFQNPDTLQTVSESLNLPIQTSKVFTREGMKNGIASNKKLVNLAFTHDILALGNNSDPISVNNNEVVVFRISKHYPASEQPFSEVSEKIKAKLVKQFAVKKAMETGQEILKSEKELQKIQQKYPNSKLDWQKITKSSRDSAQSSLTINDLAFSLAQANQIRGKKLSNGDFALVKLNSVNDGNISQLDPEQRAALTQQLESNFGVMDYDLYVTGLMKQADVDRKLDQK